jgi:hypothetical protein
MDLEVIAGGVLATAAAVSIAFMCPPVGGSAGAGVVVSKVAPGTVQCSLAERRCTLTANPEQPS